MLQPKRTKFRKMMKGRNRGLAHRGSTISFGEYGLKGYRPRSPYCSTDRICSSCTDTSCKTWRKNLDSCFSRQADYPEAS